MSPLSFKMGRRRKKQTDKVVALEVSSLMAMSRRRLQMAKDLHGSTSKIAGEDPNKLQRIEKEAFELVKEARDMAAEAKRLMAER
jgi:hypothetical protein